MYEMMYILIFPYLKPKTRVDVEKIIYKKPCTYYITEKQSSQGDCG